MTDQNENTTFSTSQPNPRARRRTEAMEEVRIVNLVEQAQSGDRAAFGELAKAFNSMVFAIVLQRLRNRSESHEVTQDVFIQAMRKLSQLRDPSRFPAWLRQIAVRMALNRAVRRPNEATHGPESLNAVETHERNPLDDLLRTERLHQVRGGLARLRELDRQTLIAFYFDGRSLKEMSDDFDSPIGTIKRRLHTARNRLRDELMSLQPV